MADIQITQDSHELAVGSTIYHRNGTPVVITGETKVSWILGDHPWDQVKLKKSAMRKGNSGEDRYTQYFVRESDALDCAYATRNYYKIGHLVESVRDGALLRKIADMIGYKEVE